MCAFFFFFDLLIIKHGPKHEMQVFCCVNKTQVEILLHYYNIWLCNTVRCINVYSSTLVDFFRLQQRNCDAQNVISEKNYCEWIIEIHIKRRMANCRWRDRRVYSGRILSKRIFSSRFNGSFTNTCREVFWREKQTILF